MININNLRDIPFDEFLPEYEKAHAALGNNLSRMNLTNVVFSVLHGAGGESKDLKVCYAESTSRFRRLAATIVNNASIFNDTGLPDPE